MIKSLLVILFLVSLLVSCSKKASNVDLKYTAEEMTSLLHEASLNSEKGESALNFSDYAPGANHVESKSLKYQRLAFFAISFETSEQARVEALRLNQYYARNWLFDRVEGEPVLEDYVIKTFKAINPNKQIQRVPKDNQKQDATPAHHH